MISDDTLVALRDNEDRLENLFVYLDDFSLRQDDDGLLLRALQGNTRVSSVDVDMHLDEAMTDAIGAFLAQVGRLQNLRRLRCSSSGDYAITMAAMARALEATPSSYILRQSGSSDTSTRTSTGSKLTSLDLANFLLQTNHEEEGALALTSYPAFVAALRHHPSVQHFTLGFGYSTRGFVPQPHPTTRRQPQTQPQEAAHCSLTPLCESLGTISTLVQVRLDGAWSAPPGALTPRGLQALLVSSSSSSSTLTRLEVLGFDVSLQHLTAMSQALETNRTLQSLTLACRPSFIMTKQPTSAAVVDDNSKDPRSGAACLARVFRQNRTLETLHLPLALLSLGWESIHNNHNNHNNTNNTASKIQCWIDLFRGLELNPTLKELQFTTTSPMNHTTSHDDGNVLNHHPETTQAFRHMLQHNYGLVSLVIPTTATTIGYNPNMATPAFTEDDEGGGGHNPTTGDHDDDDDSSATRQHHHPVCQAEIDLHMKLNAMGRGKLIRGDGGGVDGTNTTNSVTTRNQWIDAFGRVQNDVSCLFHLLLLNPLLCSGGSGSSGSNQNAVCMET